MARLSLFNFLSRLYTMFFLVGVLCFKNHSEDINDSTVTANSKPKDSTVARIFEVAGGEQAFREEFELILAEASSMHNDLEAIPVGWSLGTALVAKICFTDDVCWAVKIEEFNPNRDTRRYGAWTKMLMQEYCPSIPIDRFIGCKQHKLLYCFTEWIEGKRLWDIILPSISNISTTFSIPENIVTSLAQFIYNLTTCPIPRHESIWLFQSF